MESSDRPSRRTCISPPEPPELPKYGAPHDYLTASHFCADGGGTSRIVVFGACCMSSDALATVPCGKHPEATRCRSRLVLPSQLQQCSGGDRRAGMGRLRRPPRACP